MYVLNGKQMQQRYYNMPHAYHLSEYASLITIDVFIICLKSWYWIAIQICMPVIFDRYIARILLLDNINVNICGISG